MCREAGGWRLSGQFALRGEARGPRGFYAEALSVPRRCYLAGRRRADGGARMTEPSCECFFLLGNFYLPASAVADLNRG